MALSNSELLLLAWGAITFFSFCNSILLFFYMGGVFLLGLVFIFPVRFVVAHLQNARVLFFGQCSQRKIALTFDDGPDPVKTAQILEVLAKHNARASFFVNGECVEQYPDLTQQIVDQGHILCNHHWRDEKTVSLSLRSMKEGMEKTHQMIQKYQPTVKYFRPGVGFYNKELLSVAAEFDYKVVLGDIYPHDVVFGYIPELVSLYVLYHVDAGSIVILHDKQRLPTETTLDMILEALSRKGYVFCTLDELFDSTESQT